MIVRPNLPRLMSLSLTFYFRIYSCQERQSNQVVCDHFWEYGRATGIINQDCPSHSGSGWPTQRFHVKGRPSCCTNGTRSDLGHLDSSSPLSPRLTPVPTYPHHSFLSCLPGTTQGHSHHLLWDSWEQMALVSLSRYFHVQFILNILTTSVFVQHHFHQPTYTKELLSFLFTGLSPTSSDACGSWSASCWPVQG